MDGSRVRVQPSAQGLATLNNGRDSAPLVPLKEPSGLSGGSPRKGLAVCPRVAVIPLVLLSFSELVTHPHIPRGCTGLGFPGPGNLAGSEKYFTPRLLGSALTGPSTLGLGQLWLFCS